jgi:Cu+-exporting ATPase
MSETETLRIAGMTCALCSLEIERKLLRLAGIERASVSYASERASIGFRPEIVSRERIQKEIQKLGFEAEDEDSPVSGPSPAERQLAKLRASLFVALVLSSPLFFMMLLTGFKGCHAAFDPATVTAWGKLSVHLSYTFLFLHDWRFQLLLVTPVQFIVGRGFYRNAFRALRSGVANMDILVVLGTTAAYAYSLYAALEGSWSVYNHPNLYFEAGSTVITLILLGKYLEALAKRRTRAELDSLADLAPPKARLIVGGEEREVSLSELGVGDILLVHPGEGIPVDGLVIEGSSTVDESMLSGESRPAEKSPGSRAVAGSVNLYGSLRLKAEKVGEDTRLAGIVRIVREAQATKADAQGLVDRICGVFVPAVIAIAMATFLAWFFLAYKGSSLLLDKALVKAISVLVVSCPCALGLATPAALVVGMGAAARRGILFKDGRAMERLAAVDLAAFDKTGTLTEGRPSLSSILLFGSFQENEALRIAAAAERRSEQPYGRAISDAGIASLALLPEATSLSSVPGKGVAAEVEGRNVLAGSPAFLEERGVELSEAKLTIDELRRNGRSVVALAVEGELEAIFSLDDKIRPSAAGAVASLSSLDLEVRLLTGDDAGVARRVADEAGIGSALAALSPEGKAEEIGRLKDDGWNVAMIGDGINDAPALAAAWVGIAMGEGTDIAIETGDVIVLGRDLTAIPNALLIARKTMGRIKANLFWAFGYNAVCISIAAAGYLSPELAALAMAASSITVLIGSLSLKRWIPGAR